MLFAAALLLAQTAPVAQTTACKTTDASLPASLAGWSTPGDRFVPGKAVTLNTVDGASLGGLPAGTRPGRAATIGFTVATAGLYGVALDQPGWIDLLPGTQGAVALASAKHGRGPDCSTIRKIVRSS